MEIVKNRIVLIAGAANDVGEAIGLRLAAGGAKVVLVDDDKLKIDNAAQKIKSRGFDAVPYVCNTANEEDVKSTVRMITENSGRIDVLINNVDDPKGKDIVNITNEDWDESFKKNLKPLYLFCHETVPVMQKNRYGRIINVGSLNYLGWPGKANYSAAKSAILGFTRSLALETGRDNITVNSVIAGDVDHDGLSEEERNGLIARLPVNRLGTSDDIAYGIAFFSSDKSKYVTGQTLFICGGKSIHFSMSV